MSNDGDYVGTLLEDLDGKFDYMVDAIGSINDQLRSIPKRDEFNELKAEVRAIHIVVSGHNKQLSKHESRITKLESAA